MVALFQTAHLSSCHTHLGQLLPKLIQFLLQRSLLLLGGSHLVTNLTDLGGDARSYSNADGFSSSDIGALSSFQKKKYIRLFWWCVWTKKLAVDQKSRLTENSMFFLSWLTARGSGTDSVCLITLTDSPVRDTSLVCRWFL